MASTADGVTANRQPPAILQAADRRPHPDHLTLSSRHRRLLPAACRLLPAACWPRRIDERPKNCILSRPKTAPSSSGLGHRPFTAATRVRIPSGSVSNHPQAIRLGGVLLRGAAARCAIALGMYGHMAMCPRGRGCGPAQHPGLGGLPSPLLQAQGTLSRRDAWSRGG